MVNHTYFQSIFDDFLTQIGWLTWDPPGLQFYLCISIGPSRGSFFVGESWDLGQRTFRCSIRNITGIIAP